GGEDLVELVLPTVAHIPSITIVLACSKAGRYSKIFTPASSRGPHGLDERGEDIVLRCASLNVARPSREQIAHQDRTVRGTVLTSHPVYPSYIFRDRSEHI